MPSPLVLNDNSLIRVSDTEAYLEKYFDVPGRSKFEALSEKEGAYEKSYILIRASESLDAFLRTLSLLGTMDDEKQRFAFPRNQKEIPESIKEGVFLQALHLLEYSDLQGVSGHTKSQSIGALSKTVDNEALSRSAFGISKLAARLIQSDANVVVSAHKRLVRA